MARVAKDVLKPGTYRLPNGSYAVFTREDCRHLARRLQAMLAAGLQVPVSLEHQNVKPATEEEAARLRAERVRLTLGHAAGSALGADATLFATLDIPDPADLRLLPKVRYVSPEIVTDWTDGTGRMWPGKSISHIALTPRPVQHGQMAFPPDRLSTVRLSLSDRVGGDKMADENGKGMETKVKRIRGALSKLGIEMPDHVDPGKDLDGWLDCLLAALMTKAGYEEDEDEPSELNAPVAMSLGTWEPARELSPSETERQILAYEKLVGRGSRGA